MQVKKMDILDKFIESANENLSEGYYNVRPRTNLQKIWPVCKFDRIYNTKAIGLKSSLLRRIKAGFTLITEIKHASPAGEYSFEKMRAEDSAIDFMKNGADAISVVVEPKIFKGKLVDVPLAKKAGLPVLFKDFIIDKKQIIAARNVGADAVLLIVKVARRLELDLDDMIAIAHENELEVLLESYDEDEIRTAMKTKADILGINNRDLQTLKVDIGRTKRIISNVGRLDRPLISESGIKTADDVAFVKKAGASGALVGTAIWKSDDVGKKIKELKQGARDE
jgi:indole-3-glycerol phosphate synthase